MKHLIILSVAFVFLSGCDGGKKGSKKQIFGAMAVQNQTDKVLDVSVVMDGIPNDFGVFIAGATATMGGGRFELGKELKVVWIEDFGKENQIKGEAFFDSSKLSDIADKIKEIEFVYLGEKKWKLRAYKKNHRYDEDLIREIFSIPEAPKVKK